MIIVQLKGGLGNQMFQYAMGRRLSVVHRTQLKLDRAFYDGEKHGNMIARPLSLLKFPIAAEFASREDIEAIARYERPIRTRLLAALAKRVGRHAPRSVSRERTLDVDELALRLPDNVYLRGYWQSERYFSDIADTIRAEFRWCRPPEPADVGLLEQIQNNHSVAVHCRRGDYASNPNTHAFHGTCSPHYYRDARSVVERQIAQPIYFVFSDDPDWAKSNLNFGVNAIFMEQTGPEQDFEALRLMTACKHQIIANSSFSWWAAWLNPNPNKIVVAPRRWFRAVDVNPRDRFPAGWTLIDS